MKYPSTLIIETSSVCDLKCVMCPHSGKIFPRNKIFLPDLIIDKIQKYVENAKCIQLHGIGEPLLSPSFWEVLQYISEDCRSGVNSNFLNVPETKMYDLVNSNLKHLCISIDSPDIDTYFKIRGDDLNKVIANIRKLNNIMKNEKSSFVVTLNMTLMRENITQLGMGLDLCKELDCFGLDTWPMNNSIPEEMEKNVNGWKFNYVEQSPYGFKDMYNESIKTAIVYAEKIQKGFTYNFL